MVAADAVAPAAVTRLGFVPVLLCGGAVLILAAPFLWLQAQAAAPGRSP
jgi:hypothetical protein